MEKRSKKPNTNINHKNFNVRTALKAFDALFLDWVYFNRLYLIENKEKYGLIWFDLESISRPIDKLRVKAKTLCENQLTEIKTEQQGRRNWWGMGSLEPPPPFWLEKKQSLVLQKALYVHITTSSQIFRPSYGTAEQQPRAGCKAGGLFQSKPEIEAVYKVFWYSSSISTFIFYYFKKV